MVRAFLGQLFKHLVNRILVILIIFARIHVVDHVDQQREVLFGLGCFITDVPDQRTVEQRFRFHPEVIAGLAFALGIRNERGDQFQNVLFRSDIGERVIVHALPEVDGIENLNPVPRFLQQFPALNQDAALGICHNIAAVQLHQVGFQPETCFAGAGTANNQNILVPGILGVGHPAFHRQAFRLRKDDIVPWI